MRFAATLLALGAITQTASAHYIFNVLIAGDKTSTNAVRRPQNNSPVSPLASPDMRCNVSPGQATETVTVNAGDTIGFRTDSNIYHQGPAAIYLGKAPDSAASWDGSGASWFKIAEWGATFNPFGFVDVGMNQLTTTIPKNTPSGEYLVRAEQIGLHIMPPESFMSCAQIKIINGGSGSPPMVSIPGYINAGDPSVNVNIYPPETPTSYTCPGPAVWTG